MKIFSAFLMMMGALTAQSPEAPNPTQRLGTAENDARMAAGEAPIYRITVVERTAKAVNYRNRSGATNIDFRGTALLPKSHGEASVNSKQGYIEINVQFRELSPATQFGSEYLTYVMWAITPEGRTTNLGEVLLNGSSSKLDVTTELQSFGLIVTAEPYFAVTRPSDVVVMENMIRADTQGTIVPIEAKYELLKRGQYVMNANPADLKAIRLGNNAPLELFEARNAVQIAGWTGAHQHAGDSYQKALDALTNAEGAAKRKAGHKMIAQSAREAVQISEDTRIITVKKIEAEQLANERKAGANREALAESGRTAAQSETARVAKEAETASVLARMETERVARENAMQTAAGRAEAERLKRESDARLLGAQAEADRMKQESDARLLAVQSEADRLKRDNQIQLAAAQTEADRAKQEADAKLMAAQSEADRLKQENQAQIAAAQTEADRMKQGNDAKAAIAQSELNRLKQENESQRTSALANLDRATRDKAQSEKDKAQLRSQLLIQFNTILKTRDSARGLIVSMSDVLFDTAKFSLGPAAREKLAKVAGILSSHTGLRLQVEGHTDSIGADDYNQQLSENRATSVRDYLTGAGILTAATTSKGFGKTQPVASNMTASGRQQNRRVELVVSGDIIGSTIPASPFVAVK